MKLLVQLFYQIAIILLATSIFSGKSFEKKQLVNPISFICQLPPIYFDKDEAAIPPEYFPELHVLSKYMKANPHYYIKLIAHTDSRNTEEFNLDLSKKRCQAVMEFMFKVYRIASTQFVMEPVGAKDPLLMDLPNDSNERFSNLKAQVNNRIEFECYFK